jgi:hypothetical protein
LRKNSDTNSQVVLRAITDLAATLGDIRNILEPIRYKSVPVGHLDFGQALGIDDVGFLNDVVLIKKESGQAINLGRF